MLQRGDRVPDPGGRSMFEAKEPTIGSPANRAFTSRSKVPVQMALCSLGLFL
jgi:hypothetical protein